MSLAPAAAPAPEAIRAADCVNPVLTATREVFEMMLGATPRRTGLVFRGQSPLGCQVSGVVGITGRAVGTIVVCLPKAVALEVLKRMVGTESTEIDDKVCDAVGELTNMIAGSAKAKLTDLDLSIGLPNVISGTDYEVSFPTDVKPFCILFDSELGPFQIEVGFSAT